MKNEKTHWLQSPNKNYLGHWDLPESGELTLTISSAQWEPVTNPITQKTESKRVIRFKEDVKPMICNQTNAQSILTSTGVKFMEDSGGQKITLFIGQIRDRISKENIDCLRVMVETKKPSPSDKQWAAILTKFKNGEVTVDKIKENFTLKPDQEKQLNELL